MAFFIKWQGVDNNKKGCKIFKKYHPDESHNMTSIGFIIFAPAYCVNNWKHVVRTLGYNCVVITVDETLSYKLMQLKWVNAVTL